jgi:hypothetical protein
MSLHHVDADLDCDGMLYARVWSSEMSAHAWTTPHFAPRKCSSLQNLP